MYTKQLSRNDLKQKLESTGLLDARPGLAALILAGHTQFAEGDTTFALTGSTAASKMAAEAGAGAIPLVTRDAPTMAAPVARISPPTPQNAGSDDLIAAVCKLADLPVPRFQAATSPEVQKVAPSGPDASDVLVSSIRGLMRADDGAEAQVARLFDSYSDTPKGAA